MADTSVCHYDFIITKLCAPTIYSTTTGTLSLPPEERGLITASSLSLNFEFLSNRKIFL
ncbi:MAG: hypothetical protein WHV60_08805 [Bacteroidota bacterium]